MYWRQKFKISTAVFLANRYLGLIYFTILEQIPLMPSLIVSRFISSPLSTAADYRVQRYVLAEIRNPYTIESRHALTGTVSIQLQCDLLFSNPRKCIHIPAMGS